MFRVTTTITAEKEQKFIKESSKKRKNIQVSSACVTMYDYKFNDKVPIKE